eukprot:403370387
MEIIDKTTDHYEQTEDDKLLVALRLLKMQREKIEDEIHVISQKAISIATQVLPLASSFEGRTFYLKFIADYKRYLADADVSSRQQSHAILIEEAKDSYEDAIREAENLFSTHPLRLATALNYSVFINDNLRQMPKAIELAKNAFDLALFDLESVEEERINETLRVMQLLKDNFTLWGVDLKYDEINAQNKAIPTGNGNRISQQDQLQNNPNIEITNKVLRKQRADERNQKKQELMRMKGELGGETALLHRGKTKDLVGMAGDGGPEDADPALKKQMKVQKTVKLADFL